MSPVCGQSLVIRADASTEVGTGHVMRCLALAQAWQHAGGQAVFLMVPGAPLLEDRLKLEGTEVVPLLAKPGSREDAAQTAKLAQKVCASWVVVDGYKFSGDYQRIIKNSGQCLLAVDDYGHADHYYADFVLNQNLHACEFLYRNRELYTRLLLGTSFVLLRREFQKWQGWRRETPEVAHRLLVTLGGGDPNNVSHLVIQSLQQMRLHGLEALVVVGGSNPHYEELEAATRRSSVPISLQRDITNMPELMAWADVAISGGGATCWELAFMGLPSLVITLADNQHSIAQRLQSVGLAINLGWFERLSPSETRQAIQRLVESAKIREEMTKQGRQCVDGKGAFRVAGALTQALESVCGSFT